MIVDTLCDKVPDLQKSNDTIVDLVLFKDNNFHTSNYIFTLISNQSYLYGRVERRQNVQMDALIMS